MSIFKQKLMIYFVAISVGTLLISNLAAIKLWNFFGIAVDGGVVLFPLTYIIGDLIIEFYGSKIAKNIILAGFLMNVIAVIVFYIVIALPPYEGWTMQDAFASVLGFTPRIMMGSLSAYVASNLLNNSIFVKLKHSKGVFSTSFIARAIGSSVFAHLIDTLVFETIAFLGVLSIKAFFIQVGFAYVLGVGLEIALAPIEVILAKRLGDKISYYEKL